MGDDQFRSDKLNVIYVVLRNLGQLTDPCLQLSRGIRFP